MALIHAHKKAKLVDREAVQELETKLRQDRQSCGEMALYFGGMFLWHTGRHDKAREYIDRMIKMASGNKEVSKIMWFYRYMHSDHTLEAEPTFSLGELACKK